MAMPDPLGRAFFLGLDDDDDAADGVPVDGFFFVVACVFVMCVCCAGFSDMYEAIAQHLNVNPFSVRFRDALLHSDAFVCGMHVGA
jgi:hypothetical protein